ncbi:hypothetical protein MRX96_005227 [Rhipicephalus microplus]
MRGGLEGEKSPIDATKLRGQAEFRTSFSWFSLCLLPRCAFLSSLPFADTVCWKIHAPRLLVLVVKRGVPAHISIHGDACVHDSSWRMEAIKVCCQTRANQATIRRTQRVRRTVRACTLGFRLHFMHAYAKKQDGQAGKGAKYGPAQSHRVSSVNRAIV